MNQIITPETHPDHWAVGKDFVGGIYSGRYFCDSMDSCGLWMTPRQPVNLDGKPLERVNVSTAAIGRTYHEVYRDDHGAFTTTGWLSFLRRWEDKFGEE
jgi:hypothetical protein